MVRLALGIKAVANIKSSDFADKEVVDAHVYTHKRPAGSRQLTSVADIVRALTRPIGYQCLNCHQLHSLYNPLTKGYPMLLSAPTIKCEGCGRGPGSTKYTYSLTVWDAYVALDDARNQGSLEAAFVLGGPLLGSVDLDQLFGPLNGVVASAK